MKTAEEMVTELLTGTPSALTLDELESRTKVPRKTLSGLLYRLRRKGIIHSPGKSLYAWGLLPAPLGQPFGLGGNTWMKLENSPVTLFYGDVKKRWISNEELGYAHSSVFRLRSGAEQKHCSFDWYDRTEGNDSPFEILFAGFRFLVHSYGESGIRLSVFPPSLPEKKTDPGGI